MSLFYVTTEARTGERYRRSEDDAAR
jgi:hypothetical protein